MTEATARELIEVRQVLESMTDGVVLVDPRGTVRFANDAMASLLGYEPGSLTGRHIEDLVPPRARPVHRLQREQFVERGSAHAMAAERELSALCADGSTLPVTIALSRLETSEGERVLAVVRDVRRERARREAMVEAEAERREAEVERHRLEAALARAESLEAASQVAGGIAHDLNNALTVVLALSSVIRVSADEADPKRADLDELHRAARRAADLTRKLLGRRPSSTAHPCDLNEVLRGLTRLFEVLVEGRVTLRLELDPTAGPVHVDSTQIERVLLNLATNARDAMPNGGQLTIRTSSRLVDADRALELGVRASRYTCVEFADTGCGMDQQTCARAFEPFFTTKEETTGAGLGLSTSLGIVAQSHGTIAVESTPGVGSTFTVYLPLVEQGVSSDGAGS